MICVSCRDTFLPGDVQHHSGLFGAKNEMLLCLLCANYERKLMEGTNDQPELLATYAPSSYEVQE
jgi:hypothetical protein